jgi:hypothetical protein
MAVYGAGLIVKGREDMPRALSYNAPIAFLFLVLAADLALLVSTRKSVRADLWTLAIWALAFVLLFLRLGAKTLEVSGHMVWLPLLTAQSWLYGFPRWFVCVGVLSTLWALGLKILVFGGPSGVPGTIVGALLAVGLVAAHRGGR